MGFFYTLFVTLAILFGMKIIRSIFKRKWDAGFKETEKDSKEAKKDRKWKLEATPQHLWREVWPSILAIIFVAVPYLLGNGYVATIQYMQLLSLEAYGL